MIINEYDPSKPFLPLTQQRGLDKPPAEGSKSFKDTISGFIGEVNTQHIEAGEKAESFIKGEPIDIHDVMITAEKAKTSFQLLMELRNKGLDLYREIMRMQV